MRTLHFYIVDGVFPRLFVQQSQDCNNNSEEVVHQFLSENCLWGGADARAESDHPFGYFLGYEFGDLEKVDQVVLGLADNFAHFSFQRVSWDRINFEWKKD